MSAFTDLLNNAKINEMTALEFAIFKMYPEHQAEGEECAAELAALRDALNGLFQACAALPLAEMDRMEKEISAASAALKGANNA